MGVNQGTLPDEERRCESCGAVRFKQEMVECHICAGDYTGRNAWQCATECAKPCTSCDKPTCEFHARASGECIGCSGPTDAEMLAAGMQSY